MIKQCFLSSVYFFICVLSPMVLAADQNVKQYPPFSISVSKIFTGEADVGAGDQTLQRDTWIFDAKFIQPLSRQWSLAFNLSYANLDYDWQHAKQAMFDGAVNPWSGLIRYSAGLSVMYRPNKHWVFMMAPKLQYAYADVDGISSRDSMSYGVVATGLYRFSDGNMLGLGVAYLNDISEVRTVPYLAVRWQICDNLKLGNPFSAGFTGPAGLELTYQVSPVFDIGFGTSKRTQRFLVQNEDTTVELDEWVSFLRAGWTVNDSITLNAYAGYYFNGEMELSETKWVETLDNQLSFALAAKYEF